MADDERTRLEDHIGKLNHYFMTVTGGRACDQSLIDDLGLNRIFDQAAGLRPGDVWKIMTKQCAEESLHHQMYCNMRAMTALERMFFLHRNFGGRRFAARARRDMIFQYDLIANLRSVAAAVLSLSAQASPMMKDKLIRDLDDTFEAATDFLFDKRIREPVFLNGTGHAAARLGNYSLIQAREILLHLSIIAEFVNSCLDAYVFLSAQQSALRQRQEKVLSAYKDLTARMINDFYLSLGIHDSFRLAAVQMNESGQPRFISPPLHKPGIK